jgi:hypothetical protein
VGQVNEEGTLEWLEFEDLDGNRLGICFFPE